VEIENVSSIHIYPIQQNYLSGNRENSYLPNKTGNISVGNPIAL